MPEFLSLQIYGFFNKFTKNANFCIYPYNDFIPAIKFYTFNVCLIVTGMKEVNPEETTRAYAFEMWMNAPMPMVTLFKILDVTNLVRTSRKSGLKFNMLMCWCIGKAASGIKEFYMLPVGDKLVQYGSIAVNTIIANRERGRFLRHSFLKRFGTIQRGLFTSDAASGAELPEPRHH